MSSYQELSSFSIPIRATSQSRGIDALSPSTDDIVYNNTSKSGFSSPIGRSPIPITPPHILGLFSPSEHTDAFLNSLIISPKRSKRQITRSNSPEFSDDDFSPVPLPSNSSNTDEHDDFLLGMGGMDDLESSPSVQLHQVDSWYKSESSPVSSPTLDHIKKPIGWSINHDNVVNIPPSSMPVLSESPQTSSVVAQQFVEHPNGEHPSRTLFVRNINSNIEESELRELFEAFGPTRNIYTQCKHRGFVMVSFFDIRHAKSAIRNLQGKVVRRRKLDIHYSIPRNNPSEKDQNQGTLVVFNLDPSTTQDDLYKIFGAFGEIKEIRETPNKRHHKFIEFYDVREAERAMKCLNKSEIKGKKIKIEPSRPGGRKSTPSRAIPTSNEPTDALLHQYPLAHSFDYDNASHSYSFSPPTTYQNFGNYYPQSDYNGVSSSLPNQNRRARSRSSMVSGSYREKDQYSLDVEQILSGLERRTTLMIRNIPNKYTQKLLLATIDEIIPGCYDFFYLPIDFKNKCNVGYAFINLSHPHAVVKLYQQHHMKKWDRFNSEKVCEITFARIQGKEALVLHFQNSSLMSEDKKCRPVIFHTNGPHTGKQAPFPVNDIPSTSYDREEYYNPASPYY